jgi:hypothetical protein
MSEQTAPAAPEPPALGWSQIEARAFNAVLPALRGVGEWLPLSARRAVAAAVLAELKPELDRLAEYENRITWHTTCGSCARILDSSILDSSIRETERAEQAEAAIERVRRLATLIRAGAPWTANHDTLADHILAALDEPATTRATEARHDAG